MSLDIGSSDCKPQACVSD